MNSVHGTMAFLYKCYPIWDNYRAAFAGYTRKMGAGYLVVMGGSIAVSVLQPFAAMALLSAVIYLVGSGWQPETIFLSLSGYVLILQTMQTVKSYMAGVGKKGRFLFRCGLGQELDIFAVCRHQNLPIQVPRRNIIWQRTKAADRHWESAETGML